MTIARQYTTQLSKTLMVQKGSLNMIKIFDQQRYTNGLRMSIHLEITLLDFRLLGYNGNTYLRL